jgi:exonuclease III
VTEVLTWNVAGRVGDRCERQLRAVLERAADVICLQEVTPTTHERWRAGLETAGYHVEVSAWPVAPAGSRRFAVLIATREPAAPMATLDVPWTERHLAVSTELDGEPVEVHTLHAPTSAKRDQVKVRTLETLHAAVTANGSRRILAGDLNTPRYESREGEIISFARTSSGNLRPALGERHDRAELLLVQDLPAGGWADAFRAVHGYQRRDRSWVAGRGYGYRLDHILLSPGLRATASDYVHAWRKARLSDHAALWAHVAAASG